MKIEGGGSKGLRFFLVFFFASSEGWLLGVGVREDIRGR